MLTFAVGIPSEATDFYASLAAETSTVIICSFFERRAPGLYHNTAVVFEGRPEPSQAPTARCTSPTIRPIMRSFTSRRAISAFTRSIPPVGRIGVLVCWDQWYPEAARLMALAGAEMLVYPTAIGWESSDSDDEKDASDRLE